MSNDIYDPNSPKWTNEADHSSEPDAQFALRPDYTKWQEYMDVHSRDHQSTTSRSAKMRESSLYTDVFSRDYQSMGGEHFGPDEVRKTWRAIGKYKYFIAATSIIITALVMIMVLRIEPWYEASTVLEVGRDNAVVLGSSGLVTNDEIGTPTLVNVKTKSIMLGSTDLIEVVVANLRLDEDPNFLAPKKGGILTGIKESFSPGSVVKPAKSVPDPSDIKLKQLRAESLPSAESARLAPFVRAVKDNLEIEQIRDARDLKVIYTHRDPQIAAAVVNNLAQSFIKRDYESQTAKYSDAADWLNDSSNELKAKVSQSEQALANYTRVNNIYAIDESKKDTLTTEKMARLHDQFIRAQTDRMLKQSLSEQVKAGRATALPEAFTDPKLTGLQKQANDLATTFAELKVKFGPMNPRVLEVEQQIAAVQQQMTASVKSLEDKLSADYERAVQDESALNGALQRAKADAVTENQAAIQYGILKQDVETTRSLYNDFLQKANQAKALVAEQNSSIHVVERAHVPAIPAGPRYMTVTFLGFLVSLVSGVGLALMLDKLNGSIKGSSDLLRFAQLQTLGMIPAASSIARLRKAKRKLLDNGSSSQLSLHGRTQSLEILEHGSIAVEAYSSLRTALLLSAVDASPKTILITSSLDGEGKTTTSINLAAAIAQLDVSVLIIDCDLRKPAIADTLGITNEVGLSTYLTSEVKIEDMIQKSPVANLSVLPSGPIPVDPTSLISTLKMREMLLDLARSYEYIVIDSPPIINVTDPIILSTMSDGVMLVVHGEKTPRQAVQRSREELASVGANVLGAVLNKVKMTRNRYAY